ncbi:glycosyl hydrolase [Kribbella sp. NPDC056861]|uniref:glycosyl hydrolase n=1 Tax=Kribbella sp. NPDC056861 TaxID=3154857 RepID=UPI00341EDCFF
MDSGEHSAPAFPGLLTTSGSLPLTRRAVLAIAAATAAAASLPALNAEATVASGVTEAADAGAGELSQLPRTFDPAAFLRPPADSRPTVLWFWNGPVTKTLVDTQLADLRSQGVLEVLVFPFETDALRPVFFSEEWFALIEYTLREAERHGMHVWLFNDDYFPSGRAGGFVVKGGQVGDRVYPPRPELRLHGIVRGRATVAGGVPVKLDELSRGLEVRDGRLVVDASTRDGITLLRAGADWQDYDVAARVRIDRATAGLMFRSTDESNGYLADLRTDGGLDIWRQSGGAFNLLSSGNPSPGFDSAAYHDVQIQLRGDRINASVDGVARAEVVDGSWPRGRIGVRATATQASSWDRLTVTGRYDEDFSAATALDAFDLPTGFPGPLVAVAARPAGSQDVSAIRDLTAIAQAGDAWQAPAGQWDVDIFTSKALIQDGNSLRYYLDLLDDEAVRLFLDIIPGEYVRRFPWAAGHVLRGFADDEPLLASASAHFRTIPWSASLTGELSRLGTNPAVALTAVHNDLGTAGQRLSGVFWRAVSNRYSAAYYKQQGQWMEKRGIAFISNPLWDEYGPAEQVKSSGNLNSTHQWAQIPGTDLIFDHYQRGYYRTLSRWAASAAHQVGKERVYLEAMGGAGWAITPSQVREAIGSFAVRGVNQTLLHAMFSEEANIVYPPPFQRVNPWWGVSAPLNDWIGRVMEAGRAEGAAQTGLLQPQRAAEQVQGSAEAQSLDDAFVAAVHALEDRQVDFDLVDEGALSNDPALIAHARARNGALVVGRQRYQAMVVPASPVIALGTVRTLTTLVRQGGLVVVVGEPAKRESGGADAALAAAWAELLGVGGRGVRVGTVAEAAAAVAADGRAAVTLTPAVPEVRALRVRRSDESAFLVVNERAEVVRVGASFPETGVPEVWDADTGTVSGAGVWRQVGKRTEIPLVLEPKAMVLVVFKQGTALPHAVASSAPVEGVEFNGSSRRATVRVVGPGPVSVSAIDGRKVFSGSVTVADPLTPVAIGGEWDFHFDRAGAETTRRLLGSWTGIEAGFSGAGVYEKEFTVDPAGHGWTLDLGDVREVAEVTINGTALPARLWAPYRVDVTPVLRAGANSIVVRVTNTGANSRGQALPSGLLGPVVLRPYLRLQVELR